MASTSSQTPPCSTLISTTPTGWDVFLSFRGIDTRHGFTSHLYSALDRYSIRTFMDDPELQCGEMISDALIKAIQESRIYIVVLSENYASSAWCLDELVEILRCSNRLQRLVIPVFYNILPSVVRFQNGSFKEHFKKHEDRLAGEMERVANWRLTLTEVADLSGKHIDGQKSEAHIVQEIVDQIILQINPTALDVARYPVGLNSRVKDIAALLSSGTKGVIKIGIYGMGGVGKTTLAKAVFNDQLLHGSFKGSCFLENVREISETKGLKSLQKQLINDVLKSKNKVKVSNVDQGTKLIEERICSTKILVGIDDLDDHKIFKSLVRPFASGSVVIITTRDEETLDKIEVENKYRYRVGELGDAEAKKLFFRHAFEDTEPDNTRMILSKDILHLAGGLPLALVVFGSDLYRESEDRWKYYIDKLQRNPNSTVQQRFMISLNALESDDPQLKKMFLDIACFFIGRNKEEVVEILDTYYSYAKVQIDILMKKSLLTINYYNEFRMHDLLRDVGKEIARNNDDPGKHSRLWVPKEICYVLEEQKGTEAIEGIMLPFFQPEDPLKEVSFPAEALRRMSKLRFLYFDDINLTGKFERTLKDLRWFRWDRCPLKCLPYDFCPQELVILELRRSKMTTMWEVNMVSNAFRKLKTLNMSFSEDLTTTPDFRRLRCLENLNLEGCRSLKEVHISIGRLVSLVSLNLKDCVNLRSLPNTICNLRALEVLHIQGCEGLEELPIQFGDIKSLTELHAGSLSVPKLPDSIGNLSKLVKLKLDNNTKLEYLPDTICNLRALEVLSINRCTNLEALPQELGKIESLRELKVEYLACTKLPDSIGYLSKLVELNLYHSRNLKSLPNTICNLRALEVLRIRNCTNLEALPEELGKIESLRELKVESLAVSKLPDSIGNLSKLVKLNLHDNNNLETLPNTICNLRALEFLRIEDCTNVEALPVELGNMESLRELNAEDLNISKLPDSICNMRSLEVLNISGCSELERLPDQLWKLTRLSLLDVNGAFLLSKLPALPLSLTRLDLSNSKITALPSGSQLSNLEELHLSGCDHLLSIAELPPNLKKIYAHDCMSLESLNLCNLKQLELLHLTDCSALTRILGLAELISLERLYLKGCSSSLRARTLTKPLFQIYSGFEKKVHIRLEVEKFPDWIIQSSVEGSAVEDLTEDISDWSSQSNDSFTPPEISSSVNLQPNLSHKYLGMILCFDKLDNIANGRHYSVMTSASNVFRNGDDIYETFEPNIVMVPRSIFTVTDADHTIEFTSNASKHWIHLLYKNEDDNTTVNVQDERNTPSAILNV